MSGPWRRPADWAIPLLVALPLLCQWPDLTGVLSADPEAAISGLSRAGWGGRFLPGMPWIDGNAGATLQALGGLAARQWLSGEVPWWNHFDGVGLPLAGEMQPAAFLLPMILLVALPHGIVLLKIVMQVAAGLATRALLRRLGTAPVSALAGGVLFQLDGTFAWFGDTPMLPIAFLPLLLLGIERARAGGWAVCALAVAGSLVAGFPETAYLDGLLAACWAGLRLAEGPRRLRLLARLGAGVGVGLALAAPVLTAFLELLRVAYVGGHAGQSQPLLAENWAMFLFPHLLGPPIHAVVTGGSPGRYWWSAGGYVSILTAWLATLSLTRPSRLRLLLACWIALALACAGGVTPVRAVFELVPFVRQAAFARYSAPSWEMATCLLAALAIDDVARRRAGRPAMAAACVAVAAAAALWLARGEVARLSIRPDFILYPVFAVAWGAVGVAAAMWSARRRRPGWLAAVAMVDAVGLFMLPTFAGVPHPATKGVATQAGLVTFLHERLSLQRALTLGPIFPNYGAWFEVATIGHRYLPVPLVWTDHIAARLDPGADLSSFDGVSSPDGGSRSEQAALHRAAYAKDGVGIVVSPAGQDPFRDLLSSTVPPGPAIARPVSADAPLTGEMPPELLRAGRALDRFAIEAATYAGSADGSARLRLCAGEDCVTAEVPLHDARDNAFMEWTLSPALAASRGPVTWTVTQVDGTHPFAVWLHEGSPRLRAGYVADAPHPPRVYADDVAEAYALPGAAPYFDTGGTCRATPGSGTSGSWREVALSCPAAAILVRRELSYPGWRATVDGRAVPVRRAEDVFQAIDVPAGDHAVRFAYAPTGIGWAWAAAALAACTLAGRAAARLMHAARLSSAQASRNRR